MQPVLVIALLVTILIAAGLGAVIASYIGRPRQDMEAATVARLAVELAARQDAQVAGVVQHVVNIAGESFDSRLQTGTAELEHRRTAIDLRMDGAEKHIDERLGGMSKSLGHQVTTMNGELGQLRELVAQLQKERAQQHGQFVESLEAATRQQQLLANTTQSLRDALASPQARGQWGERMAEDVLRSAGMREGFNYQKQRTLSEGTKPDFTFLLPDDRLLHMDVKFPVTNYLRYLEAPSDTEASALKDRFLRDVRDRVKELNNRGYAATDTTVGYLLLFIPNESVYGFIHEHDMNLLDDALAQKVVLCSPTTLFAVLGVIRQAMDTFAVGRASEEILDCLSAFGDQWQRFSGQIDKVERHMSTLNNSFEELAGPRRRQLERQLDRVDDVRSRSIDSVDEPALGHTPAPGLREISDRNAG